MQQIRRQRVLVAAEVENNAGQLGLPLLRLEETASALLLEAVPASTAPAGFRAFRFGYALDRIDAFVSTCNLTAPAGRREIRRDSADPRGEVRLVTARARAFLRQAGIAAADLAAAVLPPQRDRAFMAALRAVLATGPDLITAPFVGATAGRDDLASHGLAAAWTNRPQGHGGPVLLIGPSAGLQTASALHA